jgi:hypothetical protein
VVEERVELRCHAWTPSDAIRRLRVHVVRNAEALAVHYSLEGDIARCRIPPPRNARPGVDLWRHTCCEAFIAAGDGPAYHELNFSPSGEWAVLAFRGYRDGGPVDSHTFTPRIVVRKASGRLELESAVALAWLSPAHLDQPLRIGLAAVIEETTGAQSCWALQHVPGAPDFHHADGFRLRLEALPAAC